MNGLLVKDFFETQFKSYTIYDSQRSIPHVIDGQKITARKVLHTLSNRANNEIKVAQLCSSVAAETAYHHGEAGIGGVICNLGQTFSGSNNMNLLEPIGQFGSRLSPIPAAARYIFTKLSPNYRSLFNKNDELITEYLYEDDQKIEPKFFIPILPVILINGSQGIGTGYASKVLAYNPKDIKADIINILKGKTRKGLVPWYHNFTGEITPGLLANQWVIKGKLEVINSTTIKITELPIGYYLNDIKQILNKLKETGVLKDYDDNSTEDGFDIEVKCLRSTASLPINELYDIFKLTTKDTENLTLWNTNDKLQVFENASTIVDYFVQFRLSKYEDRRLALINQLNDEVLDLQEKIRFIDFYLANTSLFRNSTKSQLVELLSANGFINPTKLLEMSIYNLTKDKIDELNDTLNLRQRSVAELLLLDAKTMYLQELNDLKL